MKLLSSKATSSNVAPSEKRRSGSSHKMGLVECFVNGAGFSFSFFFLLPFFFRRWRALHQKSLRGISFCLRVWSSPCFLCALRRLLVGLSTVVSWLVGWSMFVFPLRLYSVCYASPYLYIVLPFCLFLRVLRDFFLVLSLWRSLAVFVLVGCLSACPPPLVWKFSSPFFFFFRF